MSANVSQNYFCCTCKLQFSSLQHGFDYGCTVLYSDFMATLCTFSTKPFSNGKVIYCDNINFATLVMYVQGLYTCTHKSHVL